MSKLFKLTIAVCCLVITVTYSSTMIGQTHSSTKQSTPILESVVPGVAFLFSGTTTFSEVSDACREHLPENLIDKRFVGIVNSNADEDDTVSVSIVVKNSRYPHRIGDIEFSFRQAIESFMDNSILEVNDVRSGALFDPDLSHYYRYHIELLDQRIIGRSVWFKFKMTVEKEACADQEIFFEISNATN